MIMYLSLDTKTFLRKVSKVMKNFIIGKLQVIITTVAIVLIAALAFMPLLSIGTDPIEDTETFEVVIDAAKDKEIAALGEDAPEADVAAISARYEALKKEVKSTDKSETSKFDVSVIELVKTFPSALEFALYYFQAIGLDYAESYAEDRVNEQIQGAVGDVEVPEELGGVEVPEADIDLSQQLRDSVDPTVVNSETIGMFRLFFGGFISVSGLDGAGSIVNTILVILFTVLKLVLLFSIVVVFPFAMAISLIKLIIAFIMRKTEKKSLKYCKSAIVWIGSLLTTLIVWGAEITTYGTLLIVVAAIVVAANLLASRLKSYTKGEAKFLNVMQLSALISVVGIVIFAVKLVEADLINFYLSSDLLAQAEILYPNDVATVALVLAIFAGMAALTIVVLGFVFKSIMNLITRSACMGKKGGTGLFAGIAGLALLIVSKILLSKYQIVLTAEQDSAVTVAFVGIALTLAGAIVFKVLSHIFLRGVTSAEKNAVMTGTTISNQ